MSANPSEARLQVAFGDESGPSSSWTQARFTSHDLGLEPTIIEDESIRASGEEEEGYDGKFDVSGALSAVYHAEDHERYIASHFGFGNAPVEDPTGVWTKRYDRGQTVNEFGPLWTRIDDDLGRPMVYKRATVSEMVAELGVDGLLTGRFTLLPTRADTWSDAVEVAVTATPDPPVVRGIPQLALLSAAQLPDGDIYVRVAVLPGGTQLTIEVKVGAGSAYSNQQTIETGNNADGDPIYVELLDEDGDQIGDDGLPVEVHFPNVAYTVADEFRFDREIPQWAIALPGSGAFNEVLAQVFVDGELFRLNQISLTSTRPAVLDPAIGGRFVGEVLERGDRTAEWSLSRRATDRKIIDKLIRAGSASVRLLARGDFIGATGVRRSLELRSMNCRVRGKTPGIGGRDTFDESITLRAHPSDDATYPSALNATMVNTVASIAA